MMRTLFGQGATVSQNVLWRLDPRVKLVVALAAIVAVVLSTQVILPLAVFAACVGASVALAAPLGLMLHRMAAPVALALLVCVLRALMTAGAPLASLNLGPWTLVLTRAGLVEGGLIASRVLGSVGVIVLLCTFTPAWRIFAALRWAKMPRSLVEIAMMMYRYIFTLFEQCASVHAAQKVRLGHSSAGRALRSMGELAGIVTLRSIDQADKTHEAMVCRGYRGSLQIAPLPALRAGELAAMLAAVAAIVTCFAVAQRFLA
jgi:cobalt/nickel transport system permease protein